MALTDAEVTTEVGHLKAEKRAILSFLRDTADSMDFSEQGRAIQIQSARSERTARLKDIDARLAQLGEQPAAVVPPFMISGRILPG